MRLTRIKVSNHSRIADTELTVRNHLVLVGPNNVGKSSLLRCMDFLLGSSTAQLYNRIAVADFADPTEPLVVEATLDTLTELEQGWFPDETTVDPSTGAVTLTVTLTASVDENGTVDIDRSAPQGGTNRQLSREQVRAFGWTLLGATAMTRDLRDDRRNVLADILAGVDLGEEKGKFDSLFASIQTELGNSTTLTTLRRDLAKQLSRALPKGVTQSQLELVAGAVASGDVLADVHLTIESDGQVKDMTELSDGLRALYALAMYDLASVGANVVAVDEPEIHLHPTSQRSLARLLKEGPNQKILATHSPDIVSAFAPDAIVSVRAGGQVVQPAKNFLTDDEKLVIHWWVRDKLEPLTANKVLAVEGISDRIILTCVADLTDRNLDRLGVSVVETDGAGSMRAIVKLFGKDGFSVPITLLVDEDARVKIAGELDLDPADLLKSGVFVSDPDLEGEYIAALGVTNTWAAIRSSGLLTTNQLSNCGTSGPEGAPTAEELHDFIVGHGKTKKQYKVLAALAVVRVLTAATAVNITSVNAALAEVVGQ